MTKKLITKMTKIMMTMMLKILMIMITKILMTMMTMMTKILMTILTKILMTSIKKTLMTNEYKDTDDKDTHRWRGIHLQWKACRRQRVWWNHEREWTNSNFVHRQSTQILKQRN